MVEPDWPTPGTHVTSIGADGEGKVELAPGALARADVVVVDSRELTALYGDLAYAQHAGVQLKASPIELGDLIAGRTPGRAADDQITVCKLIGLGVQDLAAANVTLERLNSSDALVSSDALNRPNASPRAERQPASALDLSSR